MRRTVGMALALLALLLVAGCGSEAAGPGTADAEPTRSTESSESPDSSSPPPVVVSYANQQLSLPPYAYCWTVGSATSESNAACADGVPPDPLPNLGVVAGEITVTFARDTWTFTASSQGAETKCAETFPATVRKVEERSWQVALAGPRGTYSVRLFGRGPGGDVAASFAVQTSIDRPSPPPVASLTTFYDHDGEPDATTFNLAASYLATTPARSRAGLTITSADARRSTYTLSKPASGNVREVCVTRGSIALSAPAPQGRVREEIGRPPYDLLVELDLDGIRYTATATWPDDVESSTSIPLHFNPPLPARR